jgi:Tn3 transposase DDE domain-containing protein
VRGWCGRGRRRWWWGVSGRAMRRPQGVGAVLWFHADDLDAGLEVFGDGGGSGGESAAADGDDECLDLGWSVRSSRATVPAPAMTCRVDLERTERNWEDVLRIVGSIHTGAVRAYDVIRTLSRDGRPTVLGDAIAHSCSRTRPGTPSGARRVVGRHLSRGRVPVAGTALLHRRPARSPGSARGGRRYGPVPSDGARGPSRSDARSGSAFDAGCGAAWTSGRPSRPRPTRGSGRPSVERW